MEQPPYPGTPRWVKVIGVIALLVLALFAHRLIGAGRGHGNHGQHPPLERAP